MTRAEKYVYAVYKAKSFSKAAKSIFISQPSLSETVRKHEAELGFSIFDRSKTPVTLTPEGKIYIDYLQESIENENNMRLRINSLTALSHEKLSVGGTNYMARFLLPKLCGEFHRHFPDVEIKIDLGETGSDNILPEKLENGTIDCMLSFLCDEAKFSYVPLFTERYVIALRKDSPGAQKLAPYALTREEILSRKPFSEKEVPFSFFENIEFIRQGMMSSTGQILRELVSQCKNSPCYTKGARKYDMKYDMMLEGMGAAIVSELMLVARPDRSDEVFYFLLDTPKSVREAKIIYKKNTPLSKSTEVFIEIARRICAEIF